MHGSVHPFVTTELVARWSYCRGFLFYSILLVVFIELHADTKITLKVRNWKGDRLRCRIAIVVTVKLPRKSLASQHTKIVVSIKF